MIEQGDIWLAELGDEIRRAVFIVSDARFHQGSARAFVAPLLEMREDAVLRPWRLRHGRQVIALDFLRSVELTRLLERIDAVPVATIRRAQRLVRAIT